MKFEEKLLFVLCINLSELGITPRAIIATLNTLIPEKKCRYYLCKWSEQGFYEYGVALDLGWFLFEKVPERYKELLHI